MNILRLILFFAAAATLLAACNEASHNHAASGNAKRYDLRGKVVSVDKDARRARISHEEIPGFMESMTMEFPVKDDRVWGDLVPGSDIQATLVVDNAADDPFWLENLSITGAPDPNLPQTATSQPEQIGRSVPAAMLTDQDGKPVSLKSFRGKALAVTFIYAECPLPDYCIKLSRKFSDLAVQINSDERLRNDIRLLSISFDPARDTPQKLRQYGIGYMGNPENPDFTVWQLAVGGDKEIREIADFFGLVYEVDETDKATINHNLVTAVISPEGKVTKIITGNRWTTDELLQELKSAKGRVAKK